jgi:hypothetical protein
MPRYTSEFSEQQKVSVRKAYYDTYWHSDHACAPRATLYCSWTCRGPLAMDPIIATLRRSRVGAITLEVGSISPEFHNNLRSLGRGKMLLYWTCST